MPLVLKTCVVLEENTDEASLVWLSQCLTSQTTVHDVIQLLLETVDRRLGAIPAMNTDTVVNVVAHSSSLAAVSASRHDSRLSSATEANGEDVKQKKKKESRKRLAKRAEASVLQEQKRQERARLVPRTEWILCLSDSNHDWRYCGSNRKYSTQLVSLLPVVEAALAHSSDDSATPLMTSEHASVSATAHDLEIPHPRTNTAEMPGQDSEGTLFPLPRSAGINIDTSTELVVINAALLPKKSLQAMSRRHWAPALNDVVLSSHSMKGAPLFDLSPSDPKTAATGGTYNHPTPGVATSAGGATPSELHRNSDAASHEGNRVQPLPKYSNPVVLHKVKSWCDGVRPDSKAAGLAASEYGSGNDDADGPDPPSMRGTLYYDSLNPNERGTAPGSPTDPAGYTDGFDATGRTPTFTTLPLCVATDTTTLRRTQSALSSAVPKALPAYALNSVFRSDDVEPVGCTPERRQGMIATEDALRLRLVAAHCAYDDAVSKERSTAAATSIDTGDGTNSGTDNDELRQLLRQQVQLKGAIRESRQAELECARLLALVDRYESEIAAAKLRIQKLEGASTSLVA